MHRTPAKGMTEKESRNSTSPQEQQETSLNLTKTLSVRRSVGEWESGKAKQEDQKMRPTQAAPVGGASTSAEVPKSPPKKAAPKTRAEEARQCHNKAKMCLSSSRNLKSDLKNDIVAAVERLYQLVKESEAELIKTRGSAIGGSAQQIPKQLTPTGETKLSQQLEENSKLLRENIAKMEEFKGSLETQKDAPTYATAVASTIKPAPQTRTMHSVVVTSKNDTETGEEVLDKIRKALDAKEGWVKVERVRKAKDRKIIMGFETVEEREKAKRRMERESVHLKVEEVKNKDPLLVLKDVLIMHNEEELLRALKNQNREVFNDLKKEENRIEVKYRRKTRNPHTAHIVVRVSPTIWGRALKQGRLRIDLQNVFVEDQSPLVQCSKCLGYGHGRRFCKVPADLCSHCGGPHLSVGCPDRLVGEAPNCINCKKVGNDKANHNAFSKECPVRRKWDGIARSSIQYC